MFNTYVGKKRFWSTLTPVEIQWQNARIYAFGQVYMYVYVLLFLLLTIHITVMYIYEFVHQQKIHSNPHTTRTPWPQRQAATNNVMRPTTADPSTGARTHKLSISKVSSCVLCACCARSLSDPWRWERSALEETPCHTETITVVQ